MKCDYYHEVKGTVVLLQNPYVTKSIPTGIGACWKTTERNECDCGGDRAKCTFYPEVREKDNAVSGILRCPFCGGEKLKIESKRRKTHAGGYYQTRYMVCKQCHARGPVISSATTNAIDSVAWDGEVLSAWNRRP